MIPFLNQNTEQVSNTEQVQWKEGCAPKCNNENASFIEGRTPNCPESTPRYQMISSPWKQDDEGGWYNDDVCTEGEDEAEIGSAEPSEEEDTKE